MMRDRKKRFFSNSEKRETMIKLFDFGSFLSFFERLEYEGGREGKRGEGGVRWMLKSFLFILKRLQRSKLNTRTGYENSYCEDHARWFTYVQLLPLPYIFYNPASSVVSYPYISSSSSTPTSPNPPSLFPILSTGLGIIVAFPFPTDRSGVPPKSLLVIYASSSSSSSPSVWVDHCVALPLPLDFDVGGVVGFGLCFGLGRVVGRGSGRWGGLWDALDAWGFGLEGPSKVARTWR